MRGIWALKETTGWRWEFSRQQRIEHAGGRDASAGIWTPLYIMLNRCWSSVAEVSCYQHTVTAGTDTRRYEEGNDTALRRQAGRITAAPRARHAPSPTDSVRRHINFGICPAGWRQTRMPQRLSPRRTRLAHCRHSSGILLRDIEGYYNIIVSIIIIILSCFQIVYNIL